MTELPHAPLRLAIQVPVLYGWWDRTAHGAADRGAARSRATATGNGHGNGVTAGDIA